MLASPLGNWKYVFNAFVQDYLTGTRIGIAALDNNCKGNGMRPDSHGAWASMVLSVHLSQFRC